ncbi:hypothetical protein CIK05_08195 [Bdellovibrio sp. qaytius]|nr:hypothetical protein CIK05_08195 [Bdellovibrio sp. qaytius]
MKLRPLAIFAILILTQVQSFAVEDCASVDVRDSLPADVKTFMTTPSDQGDIGWCFGWAATDLLSQAVGAPVSALHTSNYFSSRVSALGKFGRKFMGYQKVPEGGDIASALKEMKSLGYVCHEKDIPSQGTHKIALNGTAYTYGGMNRLFERLKAYRENTCNDICQVALNSLIEAFVPASSNTEDLKRYVKKYPKVPLEDVLHYFLNLSCLYDKITLNDFSYGTATNRLNLSRLTDSIDKVLNQNRLIGLEYDASQITAVGGIFGGGHASTIVARKKIANQCYYLVRNSWGTSCDYRPGVICEKEQGSYWVKKDVMEKMATKIVWIK